MASGNLALPGLSGVLLGRELFKIDYGEITALMSNTVKTEIIENLTRTLELPLLVRSAALAEG